MSISANLGRQQTVELAPGPVTLRERGTGEPIVFVHGVFTNGDLWRNVVPALATRYRCLTPDWPLGSHTTPMRRDADLSTPGLARLVVEFLSTLDLDERVTLVGNDTGGAICQLVIAEHPERIGRLVLTSCDAFELYPPSPFGFLRLIPTVPGAMLLLAQTQRIRALRRLPLAYGRLMHQQPPPAVSDSYTRPGLRRQIRRTLADRLAAAFFDARRITISRARTLVAEDQPKQLATAIAAFIQDTPLAPSARARSGYHPRGEGDAWARPCVRATEGAR
jgi:pimeloyl-ACP methyl ester carboxylesterase